MVVLAALLAVSAGGPVFGQSRQPLGTVAKDTEAKRKTVKGSGKVYTNDDLKGSSAPPASAPVSTPTVTAAEPSPSGGDQTKADPAKDEAAWRDRIKAERDALSKAEAFAAALQSQINGLYSEFTACQAPTQCNEVSAKRQKAIGDLDGAKKEIEGHKKTIADIQEEARKAGVPAGWVR